MFPFRLLQLTLWNFVSFAAGILGLVAIVGASAIVLLSRKREDVHLTDQKNVEALTKLLATREKERDDALKAQAKAEDELKAVMFEHEQLIASDFDTAKAVVSELIGAHQIRRENEILLSENAELRRQLLRQ